MNRLVVLFSAVGLILSGSYVFANEIVADSHIANVTVYPDSALISRQATVQLNPGEHKVIFADIIPEIDENSLRVSAEGVSGVKLFGAQLKKEFLQELASEKAKQLKQDIQKLEDQIKETQDFKTVLMQEKDFLDSIRLFSHDQLPKDLVTKMPSSGDLEGTLKFLSTKLKENYSQAMDYEIKIRDLMQKVDVLKRELAEISGPAKKLKRSIVVDLEAVKSGSLDLKVSYLVRGAWWQPIYDARADFEKSSVELISYGLVKQKTGEDWQDVEVSLSTARATVGARMPYVSPWLLRPYQQVALDLEEQGGGRARGKLMMNVGAPAPVYQREAFDELKKEKEAAEVPYAVAQEHGIAVIYKLPRKATVKSDGSEHKLAVSSQMLAAKFEYSSYPKAGLSAYLGSRVTNARDLQLLAGRVNVFLEGDFVGASSIDNIAPAQDFDLYLGMDENVKVKREQIEKKVDETLIGGIPSQTKRTTFKYKLTVENYKSKKVTVKLFEAMPVSQDDRIKVKIEKISVEPAQKDWKDRKGVWLWDLELEPKAKKEITYTFIVDHPRDMQVEGM